jgi:hypothetical protein
VRVQRTRRFRPQRVTQRPRPQSHLDPKSRLDPQQLGRPSDKPASHQLLYGRAFTRAPSPSRPQRFLVSPIATLVETWRNPRFECRRIFGPLVGMLPILAALDLTPSAAELAL